MVDIAPKRKLRAAIYIRVSTADQKEMYGPELQEAKIRTYIELRNNDIEFAGDEYFYVDTASGADPAETRPGFTKLLNDATYYIGDNKPFDIVIVYKIDRLARKLSVLTSIVDMFKSLEIDFVSTQELIDTSSSFGKAMLGILGIFAELERDMIQERTSAGKDQALKDGKWYKAPFGYKTIGGKPVVQKDQAKIIERIFEMFVYEEKSIKQICDVLRKEKIVIPGVQMNKDPGAKDIYKWGDNTVRNILKDETYTGKYYYHKQVTNTDPKTNKKETVRLPKEEWVLSDVPHTPIVSEDLFEKANDLLGEGASNRKYSSDYLLTGLLKCDACKELREKGMLNRAGYPSSGRRKYQCNGKNVQKYGGAICNTVPMDQEDLDLLVSTKIKHLLMHPDALVEELQGPENLGKYKELLEKKINMYNDLYEKKKNALNNLDTLVKEGEISVAECKINKEEVNKQMAELKQSIIDCKKKYDDTFDIDAQMKAFEYISNFIESIDALFDDYKKLRHLLTMLIEKIIIYSDENPQYKPPGVKKKGQLFPHTMVIIFKLPQTLMDELQSKSTRKNRSNMNRHSLTNPFPKNDNGNTSTEADSAIRVKSSFSPAFEKKFLIAKHDVCCVFLFVFLLNKHIVGQIILYLAR